MKLTPRQQWAQDIRTESACIENGRAAFLLGWPLSNCPPFRDPRMSEWWTLGWRCERSDREEKRPRDQRLWHPDVMEQKACWAEADNA